MNEKPTPKTDALRDRIPDPRAIQEMTASHSDIEQKLAACRDYLRDVALKSSSTRIRRECREVYKLTEP